MPIRNDELGVAVCEALGLDVKTVRRIEITMEAGRFPEMAVTMFVTDELGGKVLPAILREYYLAPKEVSDAKTG